MKPAQIVAIVLLLSLMFGTGLQLDRAGLVKHFKNVPLILRALLANVVVVPLAGFFFVWVFHLAQPLAAGLLLMAMAPGVPFLVLSGGKKKGGSGELAVTLALILPAISAVTMPITADFLLPADVRAGVPPSQLIGLILFQVLPLVAGAVTAASAPEFAKRIARPVAVLTLAALITLLVILSPAIFHAIVAVFGKFGILAMGGTALVSLAAGWFLADSNPEHRRTMAMATLLRNPGTAAFVATAEFKDPLVMSSVLTYFVVQFVFATAAGSLFARSSASNGE